MLEIAPEKVAHVIVRAREIDAKVGTWSQDNEDPDSDAILEGRMGDATETELRAFLRTLNVDECADLVALTWIGRGTYEPEEFKDARAVAFAEATTPTEDYLLGVPLLADYLEDGLDRLGISVEAAEKGIL